MLNELTDTRHIVVGATSEIGEAFVTRLLESGAEVYALDRDEPQAAVTRHLRVELLDASSIDGAMSVLDGPFDSLTCVTKADPGASPVEVITVEALAVQHICESGYELLRPGGCVTIVSSTTAIDWHSRLSFVEELLASVSIADGRSWFEAHARDLEAHTLASEAVTVYAMAMGLTLARLGLRINAVLHSPLVSADRYGHEGCADLSRRGPSLGGVTDAIMMLNSPQARWINGHALIVDGGQAGAALTGVLGQRSARDAATLTSA